MHATLSAETVRLVSAYQNRTRLGSLHGFVSVKWRIFETVRFAINVICDGVENNNAKYCEVYLEFMIRGRFVLFKLGQ